MVGQLLLIHGMAEILLDMGVQDMVLINMMLCTGMLKVVVLLNVVTRQLKVVLLVMDLLALVLVVQL